MGDASHRKPKETDFTGTGSMEYSKVLLAQRHEKLEQILIYLTAVPITE